MSSFDIYIVVEGRTEQTFVRDVLAPEMAHRGIFLYPVLIGKPGHKGGVIRFDRAKLDIGQLLQQRSDIYVSTMFDFFRIDEHWPGYDELRQKIGSGMALSSSEKASLLEKATLDSIEVQFPNLDVSRRFIPYVEMHEFEALLFSEADILAQKAGIEANQINSILDMYSGPEDIDENPVSAPSKRLLALNPAYRKVAMGTAITKAIGIQNIRKKCSHFNKWLMKMEKLSVISQ